MTKEDAVKKRVLELIKELCEYSAYTNFNELTSDIDLIFIKSIKLCLKEDRFIDFYKYCFYVPFCAILHSGEIQERYLVFPPEAYRHVKKQIEKCRKEIFPISS